jgi:hypothetical protein
MEEYIGRETGAIPNGSFYCHDLLKLETNGVLSWFLHHGMRAGKGANEGNSMRTWLRDIYFVSLKHGTRPPDVVYTAHYHSPSYNNYIYNDRMRFGAMHGAVTPSWQRKTRFAEMVAGASANFIGGVLHEIKADGTITVPRFVVTA